MKIGDDETPGSLPPLDLGEPIFYMAASGNHTCARTQTNGIFCWGYSNYGQLGHGNTTTIGDDESPATGGLVKFLP